MSDLFRDSSLAFFIVSWKGNLETSETASSNRRTEQRFVNMPSAVIYLIITWAETKILIDPHRDNELHYPSFDGFHAQLDCKVTNVLEKWGETRLRLVCLPTELRTSCVSPYGAPYVLSTSLQFSRALAALYVLCNGTAWSYWETSRFFLSPGWSGWKIWEGSHDYQGEQSGDQSSPTEYKGEL